MYYQFRGQWCRPDEVSATPGTEKGIGMSDPTINPQLEGLACIACAISDAWLWPHNFATNLTTAAEVLGDSTPPGVFEAIRGYLEGNSSHLSDEAKEAARQAFREVAAVVPADLAWLIARASGDMSLFEEGSDGADE